MNTTKNSTLFVRFAAATVMVGAIAASPVAQAADAKAPAPGAKIMTIKASDKTEAKAVRSKAKLPRKWVWKKYAKNFDSMFRK